MLEFIVSNMSCGHCVKAVTQAIKGLDSEARVEIDLDARRVEVHTRQERTAVATALTDAGYPPDA